MVKLAFIWLNRTIHPILSAILFSIGAVMDETQGGHNGNNYVFDRSTKSSRARLVLVLKWMIVGAFLTMSYKAVLRATMMKIDYEKKIDYLDDFVQSGRKMLVPGDSPGDILRQRVEHDPRFIEIRKKKRVEYYSQGQSGQKWAWER